MNNLALLCVVVPGVRFIEKCDLAQLKCVYATVKTEPDWRIAGDLNNRLNNNQQTTVFRFARVEQS